MLTMRIGGDEFALLTGLYEEDKAIAIMNDILKQNGNSIAFEGIEYPLLLWCGITKIPKSLRYSELFNDLHQTIIRVKK